jgi:serpin B
MMRQPVGPARAAKSNLEAWLRRLFGTSPPAAPPGPPVPHAAPLPVFSIARDQKIDAIIAATEASIARMESAAHLAEDNNNFAAALHARLRLNAANQFYCPFSIRTALVMAYGGAANETSAQMRDALRISMPDDTLYSTCAGMVHALSDTSEAHELAIANSAWAQAGVPFAPAFMEFIANYFAGSWNLVDFRDGSGTARASINRWVSDRSRGRITDVLASGLPEADTHLVLVNAAYFKGKWTRPFDADDTRDEPFFLEDGRQVEVPLMRQTTQVGYHRGRRFQSVTLGYQRTNLALLVILPDRRDGLADLETAFSAAMIKQCLTGGASRVELSLPRFAITWGTFDLHGALAVLGMPLAFTPRADFSGIDGITPPNDDSLFLSSVLHKAFVEVNEEGTEAAAATLDLSMPTGLFRIKPPPVPVFRADHPFLFAICDRKSGAIIFLGRVMDPTQET